LLDEIVAHTGIHRESVIRHLNGSLERRARRSERGPRYGPAFNTALLVIWEATDYVHPERLTPNLLTTAELLKTYHELTLTPPVRKQLGKVSISTVRRHLPDTPLVHRRRKMHPPQNRYQQQIPTRRIPCDTVMPGHFEVGLGASQPPQHGRRVRIHLTDYRCRHRLLPFDFAHTFSNILRDRKRT